MTDTTSTTMIDVIDATIAVIVTVGGTAWAFGHDALRGGYWASATIGGSHVAAGHPTDPTEALDRLARMLMHAAACNHCDRRIDPSGDDPRRCHWYRLGDTWIPGCRGDRSWQRQH